MVLGYFELRYSMEDLGEQLSCANRAVLLQ